MRVKKNTSYGHKNIGIPNTTCKFFEGIQEISRMVAAKILKITRKRTEIKIVGSISIKRRLSSLKLIAMRILSMGIMCKNLGKRK